MISARQSSTAVFVCSLLLVVSIALPAVAQTSYDWATPADGLWSNAANWSPDTGRPGDDPTDSVFLRTGGATYQVTLDTDAVISSFLLASSDATLYIPSATLTVNGNSSIGAGTLNLAGGQYIQNGGTFTYSGGAITGGPIVLNSSTLTINTGNAASFLMHGNCDMTSTIRAGQQVSVVAAGQAASLSGMSGNSGTLNLDSTTADDVTLNAPGNFSNNGTLNIQPGAGGARTFAGGLTNQAPGTVNMNTATSFGASARINNSGTFSIAPDAVLDLNAGQQEFWQGGGQLDVQGRLSITNGKFFCMGGTISGNPIELNSSVLNFANSVQPASFVMHGNCTSAIIKAGVQVSAVAAGQPTSVLVSNNYGTLNLDSTSAHDVTLNSTSSFTNQGVLNVLAGAGGNRKITTDLINSTKGTVNLNATTTFTKTGAQVRNSGAFNIGPDVSLELTDGQGFNQFEGTLNVAGHLRITNGALGLGSGTITGNPIELTASTVSLWSSTPASLIAHGSCSMLSSSPLASGQQISIVAAGQPASLSYLKTNNGTINLDSTTAHDARLAGSDLTNNGTINVQPGAGGTRTIELEFTNGPTGTININAPVTFDTPYGQITNSGTFNISPGASIDIPKRGVEFRQAGGTLNVGGSMRLSAVSFVYEGGVITGGPIDLTDSMLYLSSPNPGSFVMHGNCQAGSAIGPNHQVSIEANGQPASLNVVPQNWGTLTLTSSTADEACVAAPGNGTLTNSGIINVEPGAGGARTIKGSFTNDANGTLNINASTLFSGSGTITNQGTINMAAGTAVSRDSSGPMINQGAFNIPTGASVDLQGGGQWFTQSGGTLNVQGHLGITNGRFEYTGGSITGGPIELNAAILDTPVSKVGAATFVMHGDCAMNSQICAGHQVSVVASGQPASLNNVGMNYGTINLDSTSAHDVSLNPSGSPGITNAGTINVLPGAGGGRSFATDLYNNAGASVNISAPTTFGKSAGTVTNNGAFNIASGTSFDLNRNYQTFSQRGGTLDNQGRLIVTNGNFNYTGGSITGNPVELSASSLDLETNAQGSFVMHDTCMLAGSAQIASSQRISVVADGKPASLTMLSGMAATNSGTLELDSTSAHDVTLSAFSPLVNSGVFNVQAGAGGRRTFTGDLQNSTDGRVNLNASTSFGKSGARVTNAGAFNIAAGATLDMTTGGQAFTQSAGTLDVQGHMNISNGGFTYSGGTISGNPIVMTNSTLNIQSPGQASFTLRGECSLYDGPNPGYIRAGQQISVVATGHTAVLNALQRNDGTLTLDSTGPYDVTLRPSMPFHNYGVLNLQAGAGGSRIVPGVFTNQSDGVVNVSTNAQFGWGAWVSNYGRWNLLTANSSATILQGVFDNSGTIAGIGTIDVSNATFNNDSLITPGFSAGALTVRGDYHQLGNGSLDMELGGTAPGTEYDQFNVLGTAFLDGGLQVSLIDSFTPSLGDSFKILSFSGAQGRFAWLNLPGLDNGLAWDTTQLYTIGTITVTPEPATALLAGLALGLGGMVRRNRRRPSRG